MGSNILVRIGAVVLAVVVVLLVAVRCGGGADVRTGRSAPADDALTSEMREMTGIEADTNEDEVRTLVIQVQQLQRRVEDLQGENERVLARNRELSGMETRLRSEVREESAAQRDAVTREVRSQLEEQRGEFVRARSAVQDMIGRIPGGASAARTSGAYVWSGDGFGAPGGVVEEYVMGQRSVVGARGGEENPECPDGECLEKVYTVPRNSVLTGASAVTGLIGRVPNGETVSDPYPFKIVLAARNLIANGWEIPEVQHAVVSGLAHGDWTLSCVRGGVESMTFVFNDGRVTTLPRPGTPDAMRESNTAWAWLSDDTGHPCVPGRRVTNARRYLLQMMGAETVGALGAAYAEAQTVRQRSRGPQGTTTTVEVVPGQEADYAAGRAAVQVVGEFTRYMRGRLDREVDVVYVAPGTRVSIHLETELQVDYRYDGRRVRYAAAARFGPSPGIPADLD